VRHHEKSPRIPTVATIAFGEVENNATRCALDLICSFGAVLAKLRDHRAQCSNQIQCDVIGNQHVFVSLCELISEGKTPPADDLRGWATPVATDPREDP
jgi:hypothetical protein